MDVVGWNPTLSPQQSRSFLSMMKSYCSVDEYRFIQTFSDVTAQLRVFHLFWSLKEALLKAIGCGIADPNRPLSRYDFSRCRRQGKYWLFPYEGKWMCIAWMVDEYTIVSVVAGGKAEADASAISMGGEWGETAPMQFDCVELKDDATIAFQNGECTLAIHNTSLDLLLSEFQ